MSFLAQSSPETNSANPDQPADTTVEPSTGQALARIDELLDGFLRSLPDLGIAVIVFIAFYFFAKVVKRLVSKAVSAPDKRELSTLLGRLASVAVVVIGLLVAAMIVLPDMGPGALLANLGVGGVAIGFAFKDILQNFLAGILILLKTPFRVGDVIRFDGFVGTVDEIETRMTVLRTFENDLILIPNGQIYTNPVEVVTALPSRRSDFMIGVGYDTDLKSTLSMLTETVQGVDKVLEDPAPDVTVADFGESSINLQVRFWTKTSDAFFTRSAVKESVKTALDGAGVDIPYPIRSVTIDNLPDAMKRQGE